MLWTRINLSFLLVYQSKNTVPLIFFQKFVRPEITLQEAKSYTIIIQFSFNMWLLFRGVNDKDHTYILIKVYQKLKGLK
jgi:hypothetical protein